MLVKYLSQNTELENIKLTRLYVVGYSTLPWQAAEILVSDRKLDQIKGVYNLVRLGKIVCSSFYAVGDFST